MHRKFRHAIFVSILLIGIPCMADSLQTRKLPVTVDSVLILPDSSFVLSDSSRRFPSSARRAWFYPLGIMIISAAAVIALYSVRSK